MFHSFKAMLVFGMVLAAVTFYALSSLSALLPA